MGKSAAANWAARWTRGTVPNRANDPKRQMTRAINQGKKASKNYNESLTQHGANVKAFGSGQNSDWTPSKSQKEHEQHSQMFMEW